MGIAKSYLLKTSNIGDFFTAIQSARAPERFTYQFLKNLDFKSSNDRLYIGVLKSLGFLDENGAPQQRYFEFLDQTESARILAAAIQDAYGDLFDIRRDAQNMTLDEVKGKFKSLTAGEKSENVVSSMAATFKALCDEADWTPITKKAEPNDQVDSHDEENDEEDGQGDSGDKGGQPPEQHGEGKHNLQLHYNIQLILPPTRDPAVFDAIFSSLKRHLV